MFTGKCCTLFSLLLLVSVQALAQRKTILVKDARTLLPVPGASVTGNGTAFAASSDGGGNVNLSKLPPSVTLLKITSVGYAPEEVGLDTLKDAVLLQPGISDLKEVEVTATGNHVFKNISDLDIHLRPIINSQEVMRLIPGLFIAQHAGGGKAEQMFLRGFDLDHGTDIAVSVDGIPVNMVSHAHGQGYCDLHWVIPEMIEDVTFDKGPYFADKGNLNTSGFVDFKMKDYLDRNFLKLEGGQYRTGRIVTGLNLLDPVANNGRSLLFGGEASYSDNYFVHNQNFSRFNGMLRYITPTGKNSTLNILATGFTSQWNASGQIPDRAVAEGLTDWFGSLDPSEGGHTARVNFSATHTAYLGNGATLKNQLFYSYYRFNLYSDFTFYLNDTANADEINQREHRSMLGYNGSYRQQSYWGTLPVQTEVGLYFRQDWVDSLQLAHVVKRQFLDNIMLGNVRETDMAAYAFQNYQVTGKFKITLGLRSDYFLNNYQDLLVGTDGHAQAGIVSPKLNFSYRFSNRLMLYEYNGKGFHSNDTRVVVAQDGKQILPPAWGNDLGMVWKPRANLMIQAAVFHLWMKQEFVYVGDEGVVEPSGPTRRLGADFTARYEPLKNWFVDASLNYSHGRYEDEPKGEHYIPLAPTLTSTGGITYRSTKGLNGSLRYRYMDNRPGNEDYSLTAQGYFITDLALNYTLPKWEAGITVQNLFDTKWKEAQFETDTRLRDKNGVLEPASVDEMDFTPGTPFFLRASLTVFF